MSRLVMEAARHGQDHWTEEQRRLYSNQPNESQQQLRQTHLLLSETDYLRECAVRVNEMLQDPLVSPNTQGRVAPEPHPDDPPSRP